MKSLHAYAFAATMLVAGSLSAQQTTDNVDKTKKELPKEETKAFACVNAEEKKEEKKEEAKLALADKPVDSEEKKEEIKKMFSKVSEEENKKKEEQKN